MAAGGDSSVYNLKAISRELQCAACKSLLEGPTAVCENGHTYCSSCRRITIKCRLCFGELISEFRNTPVEHMVSQIRNRCPYHRSGCKSLLTAELLPKHAETCSFKIVRCPLCHIAYLRCTWRGPASAILHHVGEHHEDHVIRKGHFDCKNMLTSFKLIIHEDELFLYYKKVTQKTWCALVASVGLTQQQFKSIITLKNPEEDTGGNEEKLTATFLVDNASVEMSKIISSGKCLVLDDVLVRHFVKSDGLNMMVSIEKI